MKTTPPRARRLAATASLVACAGGLAALGISEQAPWLFGGLSALTLAAAVGLGQPSIVRQVLARGVAWAVLGPALLASVLSYIFLRSVDAHVVGLAAGSALALLLARPMLHTELARAEFAPVVFRRWLLAGSVASVGGSVAFATVGIAELATGELGAGAGFVVLAASLLASAIGVVRMRGWGLLLGMLTSVAVGVAAFLTGGEAGAVLAVAAAPGLMFSLPVLLRRQRPADSPRPRVAPVASGASPQVRVSIGDEELSLLEAGDTAIDGEHDTPEQSLRHLSAT